MNKGIELGNSDVKRTRTGRDCPMGVGCPRSEHDDALGILKSPMELEEITSSAEIYQLTLLTLVNQSLK